MLLCHNFEWQTRLQVFYRYFIRPLLFLLEAEKAHELTFRLIRILFSLPLVKNLVRFLLVPRRKELQKQLMGLTFPNPVGLAAGLDKNARLIDELACFGFGFIEIGTVTPQPQSGNPKPRLFRLVLDKALINRMGFNNDGAQAVAQRLQKRKARVIIGGNIGKNKDTPNETAFNDYMACFETLFDWVDYFVVNVSSPNTAGLRQLQDKELLKGLLHALQEKNQQKPKPKPLLLKIAPDLTTEQLDEIIDVVLQTKLAGVIATNTTTSRHNLQTSPQLLQSIGAGGLSGAPLKKRSTEIIRYLAQKSNKQFVIIGAGGIFNAEDALEKLRAGADLVQVYTGFVYEGPAIVKKIVNGLQIAPN
ncbi:MAG: quinone-dependent dihydroorotate dehydrogenase [Cytophagales bacterium]|nr:quinone-dependent dihydroorotate dehydrogenase [Bernardetiaceae bacterium]MDW8211529.1 quinone-dependent dihydroorotate dehydrogenase [Cytophagales bacterium]